MKKIGLVFSLVLFFSVTFQVSAQWFPQNSGITNRLLTSCDLIDSSNGWVVGDYAVLKTTNGGVEWITMNPESFSFQANAVCFIDDLIGFIGVNNKVYLTFNGGENWEVVLQSPYSIYSIFLDNTRIWAAGGDHNWNGGNCLFYTEDGYSWVEIQAPTDLSLNEVFFKDPLNGFVVGNNGLILKTTNAGDSWSADYLGSQNLHCIYFSSLSNGWIGTYTGIYKTSNAGISWNYIYIEPSDFHSIYFMNDSLGFACGEGIFMTRDGGVSWELSTYWPLLDLHFADDSNGWAVGSAGMILHTSNTGGAYLPVELISFEGIISKSAVNLFWSTATELNNNGFEIERSTNKIKWATIGFVKGAGTTTEPQQYSFSNDISGISTQKLYYRLKQLDFNGTYEYSNVVEVEITPSKFALHQNYPNPFNPSTKISWQSPVSSWQTLKVYDILGNEVATLVDEYRNAGSYNAQFTINNVQLSSGVYFYQLRVGDYLDTKKMILLK